ncbi:carboxylesterase/lipase family protein [Sphingomonas sp. MMS24-J13]|uniref:carboxylesterase/lipase family protein n=1 Tax=Sphingomonas sp. MMS24-J13 TaxID=3238686 RepID=UPI00384E4FD0
MTIRTVTRRLTLISALLAGASVAHADIKGPVRTTDGLISGTPGKDVGVTAFKGIPFAAPPVGNLRWKAPQPAAKWSGVRDGSKYGKVCMQQPGKGRVNPATDMPDSPGMSEDCLYLNLWTAAKGAGEKRPVMVWLYGGAYTEGGGSSPFSEGDKLARKGVVLVTINYRNGAFGFLSHPELTAESPHHASGNYALMDSIAALQWVKANIAKFGGDPNNVTVFGESAGACMSAALAGSPEAKGLIRRAISESGAWMGLGITKMMPLAAAEAATVKTAAAAGAHSLAEMRAMSAEDVLNKLKSQGMMIDGWVIPEDLSKTFAEGRQNKVDVLVGSNGEEGSFAAAFGPPMTAASWKESAAKRWGTLADAGLAAYPAATDAEAKAVASMPFADAMAWHMRLYAEDQAKIGAQAWLYHFTHRPPYDPGKPDLGAAHTAEIPYVFDNLAAPRTFPGQSSVALMAGNPTEEGFADQVSSYWVNFARTGNPNGAGLPAWPAVNKLGPTEAMVLDAGKSGRGPWLTKAQIAFYDQMYARDVGKR